MIVTCEVCGTSYKLKASQLKPTGSMVRCSKCENVFEAFPPGAGPETSADSKTDLTPDIIGAGYEYKRGEETQQDAEATEKALDSIFDEDEIEEEAAEPVDRAMDLGGLTTEETEKGSESVDRTVDLGGLTTEEIEGAGSTSDWESEIESKIDGLVATEPEITAHDVGAGSEEDLADFEKEETGLFDDAAEVSLDSLSADDDVETISFKDIELDDEIVGLTDLELDASARLELAGLTSEPDETGVVDLDDLEELAPEAEADLDSLMEEPEPEEGVLGLDTLEAETESIGPEAFESAEADLDLSDLSRTEEIESEETAEAETTTELTDLERGVQPEDIEWVEQKEREFETKGGLGTDLDDFGKTDSKEPPKKSEDAGKTEEEELTGFESEDILPETKDESGEKAAEPEEFGEADFELDLDLESEAEGAAAETPIAEEKDLDLNLKDLDLDLEEETEAPKAGAEEAAEGDLDLDLDEFDLDLDLSEKPEAAEKEEIKEEEFDLDLGPGEERAPEAEEFSLDLDLEEGTGETLIAEEKAGATEDEFELDLDLGEEGETTEATSETEEDLSFELDLSEEPAAEEKAGATVDEFDLDLDMDMDLGVSGETVEASTEGEDLSFDLEEEPGAAEKAGATEEEFELDLDLEPEAEEAAVSSGAAEEEFDLSDVEDFLDLEEAPAEVGPTEAEDDFDLGLETAAEPTMTKEAEDEFDLDLETMLDEEGGVPTETDKEVSLETVGNGRAAAQKTEKPAPITGRTEREMEEWVTEISETQEAGAAEEAPEFVTGAAAAGREAAEAERFETTADQRKPAANKSVVIGIIAVIVLALIIIGAYLIFGGKPKAPAPVDMGNLQMQMIPVPSYTFVENEKAGDLLVVTGSVTNRYSQARKDIKVQGNLFDASGKLIRTSTAYCGITLNKNDLQTSDIKSIEDELNHRKGEAKAIDVKPGEKIPFTVVFSNLPKNMDELSVWVLSSSKE